MNEQGGKGGEAGEEQRRKQPGLLPLTKTKSRFSQCRPKDRKSEVSFGSEHEGGGVLVFVVAADLNCWECVIPKFLGRLGCFHVSLTTYLEIGKERLFQHR